jgi:hypothetical protein
MKRLFSIMVLVGFALVSCDKEKIVIDPDNLMLGTWSYVDFTDGVSYFNRTEEFTENHCYKFNSDGTLVERKNSGWCGTPPITYADYDGTWRILNDSIIKVVVGYWGGTSEYFLDVELVNEENLGIITIIETE